MHSRAKLGWHLWEIPLKLKVAETKELGGVAEGNHLSVYTVERVNDASCAMYEGHNHAPQPTLVLLWKWPTWSRAEAE